MKATQKLHDLGQSIWLDNITREMLDNGAFENYINEFSVTGLTSNPIIFDHAIKNSSAYHDDIRSSRNRSKTTEKVFFELALTDSEANSRPKNFQFEQVCGTY